MKVLLRVVALVAILSSFSLGGAAKISTEKPEKDLHEKAKDEIRHRFNGKNHEDTVERIREHEQKRLEKIEALLEEKKGYLLEHKAGRLELTENDIEFYTRQVKAFQQKVDKERSMTDEEFERSIHEKAANLHKVRPLYIPEL